MVPCLTPSVCNFRSTMAFFCLWLLDVIQDFQELAPLFKPKVLDYVITVGSQEPMAFLVYVWLIVHLQRHSWVDGSTDDIWHLCIHFHYPHSSFALMSIYYRDEAISTLMSFWLPWWSKFPPRCQFTAEMKQFLPWCKFTTVIKQFPPWCQFTTMTKQFLPWCQFSLPWWNTFYVDVNLQP